MLLLTVSESLHYYMLCEIGFSKDKKKPWLGQSFLIETLEKKLCEPVMKAQSLKTSCTPKFLIVRHIDDTEKFCKRWKTILVQNQDAYRSHAAFKAQYCQELVKAVDGVNQTPFFKMHQVIKYVLNIRSLGSKLEPNGSKKEPWNILISATVIVLEIQSQEEV